MKIIINENEKNQISSKHEEFDSDILLFLMRRIKVEEKKLNWSNFETEEEPLKVIEYTFEGFPGYGFNSYRTKKEMMNIILSLLVEETDLIGDDFFELPDQHPKKQKIIKTIRKFLNNVLKNQKKRITFVYY